MALQSCRIGNVPNAIQWDDAVHTGAIETTQVIKAGNPVAANDVVTLATLGTYISSAAVIADHAIVRGDGGARGVQDSLVTIDDIGNISLAALATVDGVDISVHAGDVDAHHAQSHDAVSHSDIASSGANIDDAVAKKHTQGTDTALGGVATKNPPIDADKVIYRDSAAADVLVTSTWTQIKAFLRVYLDTIYHILGGDLGTPSAGDLSNCTGLPVATGLAAGIFNNTGQPCFQVVPSGVLSNVTGDGTDYTVVFASERFDIGADFDGTSTFTSPVTGKYLLSTMLHISGLDAAHTAMFIFLTTSNKTYYPELATANTRTGLIGITMSVIADMDANDTVTIMIDIRNGTKVVDIGTDSFFAGALLF